MSSTRSPTWRKRSCVYVRPLPFLRPAERCCGSRASMSIAFPRWTCRAYALEKLTNAGEVDQAARRHAEFFRDLVTASADGSRSQPSIEEITRYGREIDNVRAALDWSFSSVGDPAIGIILTAAYVPVWMHWWLMEECRRRIERALGCIASQANPDVRRQMQLLTA